MLFISDNKKIDSVIQKLQPSLKLKINVERDFDCGLNDVFEKRPDVVFIQNQIAGVTGESVARHIQMLLGEVSPKFIFIHDGNVKAKPIKGLYEYLIDLSQDEKTVAADILNKLNLLLGQQWQYIFATSVFDGADYEAFEPHKATPRETISSFSFEDIPERNIIEPVSTHPASSVVLISELPPDEAFEVIPASDERRAELFYEEFTDLASNVTAIPVSDDVTAEKMLFRSETTIDPMNSVLSVELPEISRPVVVRPTTAVDKIEGSKFPAVDVVASSEDAEISRLSAVIPAVKVDAAVEMTAATADNSPTSLETVLPGKSPFGVISTSTPLVAVKELQALNDSASGSVDMMKEVPQVVSPEKREWVFEGEPSLKKSTWKWYQVVELLLVVCLLVGGWYFIKQKPQLTHSVVMETNPPASSQSPLSGEKSEPAAQQPATLKLPSFIPLAGLDSAFAVQNPGWERYAGAGAEFRLFRENGELKALQVKADKGHVISSSLLKTILTELAGTGEYRVTSREKKLGFQVSHATVNGKAELLIYSKKSAVHAVVVALD